MMGYGSQVYSSLKKDLAPHEKGQVVNGAAANSPKA
jgi:hypothetical protein